MSGKSQGTSCLSPVLLSSSALTTPMIPCNPSVSFLNSDLVNVFYELIMINNKGCMSNSLNQQTSQFTVAACDSCICLIIVIYVWMSNSRRTLQSKMKCCRLLTRHLFHHLTVFLHLQCFHLRFICSAGCEYSNHSTSVIFSLGVSNHGSFLDLNLLGQGLSGQFQCNAVLQSDFDSKMLPELAGRGILKISQ